MLAPFYGSGWLRMDHWSGAAGGWWCCDVPGRMATNYWVWRPTLFYFIHDTLTMSSFSATLTRQGNTRYDIIIRGEHTLLLLLALWRLTFFCWIECSSIRLVRGTYSRYIEFMYLDERSGVCCLSKCSIWIDRTVDGGLKVPGLMDAPLQAHSVCIDCIWANINKYPPRFFCFYLMSRLYLEARGGGRGK